MQHDYTPDPQLERYVREQLQALQPMPDADLWARIEAQQKTPNKRLKRRFYWPRLAAGLLVVLTLGVGVWLHRRPDAPAQSNSPQMNPAQPNSVPEAQSSPAPVPMAALPTPVPAHHATSFVPSAAPILVHTVRSPRIGVRENTVPGVGVRFRAEEGLRYQNPVTGTEVTIPANALAYPNGDLVRGEVEMQLSEYRNHADFLSSGIPMHFADERGDYSFNSGGMFDVRVNQNGQNLRLADGKAYDMQFTPTHALTQPSLFRYDESKGAWGYLPEPALAAGKEPPRQAPVVNEATAVRDNTGRNIYDCAPNLVMVPSEQSPEAWLKEAVETGYDLAFGRLAMPKWFTLYHHLPNERILDGLEHGRIRLVRHNDSQTMFFPEDLQGFFTELVAFKDCYFICDGDSINKSRFRVEDLESDWERVSVIQEKGSRCYVSFFGRQGLLQFYATLVGSANNKNFNADAVLAEYNRLRTLRQNNFDALASRLKHFLAMAPIFQKPNEWCMTNGEWLYYFQAQKLLMRQRYAGLTKDGLTSESLTEARKVWRDWQKKVRDEGFGGSMDGVFTGLQNRPDRNNLRYALRLGNFGLHNFDQIFKLVDGNANKVQWVNVAFQTPDGRDVAPQMICVLESRTRLFFTLPWVNKMIYVPNRKFDIIVSDRNGRNYHMNSDALVGADADKDAPRRCLVEDVTQQSQTTQGWMSLLHL